MTVWLPKEPFPTDIFRVKDTWGGNILVNKTRITYKKTFSLWYLYRYMARWLEDEGWTDSITSDKRFEHLYAEARDQAGNKEIRIWWRLKKRPAGIAGGDHAFFEWKLYIDFFTLKMKNIEMMKEGKKLTKAYKGELNLWITSILVIDRQGWFDKGMLELGKEYFIRKIYKRNIRDHEVAFRRNSQRFIGDIKKFLEIPRFKEMREEWHPPKGLFS